LRDRALDAVAGASTVVVVGPRFPATRTVGLVQVCEDPRGAGPLAALAAALPHVGAESVVVLAADLPFAAGVPEVVLAALDAVPCADAAVPTDDEGRRQPLAAAYRTSALRRAVAAVGPPEGRPLREVLPRLDVTVVPVQALPPGSLEDVDTPTDLDRLRAVGCVNDR
jgi:molybdopterin-guanine dinucleotide biosynthesis protein A